MILTTFQAIVYGIIHGFTEFLPVSSSAHKILVPYLVGWGFPGGYFDGALSLGALLALLIYFRHDWASTIAGFLTMLLSRKKPRILDEWMTIFLSLSSVPLGVGWYYLREPLESVDWAPWLVAIILAASGIPLLVADSMSRRNKGMFDWNAFDATWVGILQLGALVPGFGRILGAITGGLSRNFSKEAAVKYALFASAPALVGSTWAHLRGIDFHASVPMEGVSWLSFGIAVLVTCLTGLLAIGGLLKQIERKGFAPYAVYRFLLAAAVGVVFWLRTRG